MTKRHRMTINIKPELHEKLRYMSAKAGMTLSQRVSQILSGEAWAETEAILVIDSLKDKLVAKNNWYRIWRAISISLFFALLVMFGLYHNLEKSYLKYVQEGFPVSDDIRTVEAYKAIIANKCKVEVK